MTCSLLGSKNLSIASIKMEQHKASRKTALTRAPKISARCHPYEYWSVASFWESWWKTRNG